MITPAQRKWIRAVHVAKKELGLSDEIYETVLYSAAGITSSRDIKNWQQFDTVMNAFKAMGFSYRRPSGSAAKPYASTRSESAKLTSISYTPVSGFKT